MHLVEWVDRANHKHVIVNDYVMRVAAEELAVELSRLPNYPEDYTDFEPSNEWLHQMKQRHGQLQTFAIQDVYNCDELVLQ